MTPTTQVNKYHTYNLFLLVKVSIVAKNNLHYHTNKMDSPKYKMNANSPASMKVHQKEAPLHKQENEGTYSEQL